MGGSITLGTGTLARVRSSWLLTVVVLTLTIPIDAGQNLSFGSRNAKPVPEWLNRLTIYEIWLKAFSKEGTLRGATPRLHYISELGASAIYLGPIAKRSATPHASPYNIADYNVIDAEYGTDQDLRDFVAEAHKLHLKVLLDIVYYHAAPDSTMMKDSGSFLKTPGGEIAGGFWKQPMPDFKNSRVRRYLADSLVHWVRDFDVDGFRCDVGGGVPVAFWEQARRELDKQKPDVILLSESDRPDDQLNAFDINYNFEYYLALQSVMLKGEPASTIRRQWEEMRRTMPQGARLLHFDDNHDWRRPVLEFGEEGSMVCSVLNFALDGIPLIYNGQEIGDASLTHWTSSAPIHWLDDPRQSVNGDHRKQIFAAYKKLFQMRADHAEFTSGDLVWVNNSEPDSVLSFLRIKGTGEILVILNMSNRKLRVTIDLPVMDYYVVDELLKGGQTWFPLYSGRVSTELGGFGYLVGKKIPASEYEKLPR
jgi:glycosidase